MKGFERVNQNDNADALRTKQSSVIDFNVS